MVNIKSYTDIGQSKRLSEILPVESADMWWAERYAGKVMLNGQYIVDEVPVYYPCLVKPSKGNYSQDIVRDIPCWSLSALLDVLPSNKQITTTLSRGGWKPETVEYIDKWFCEYEDEDSPSKNFYVSADNSIDTCYEMIVKLNEINLL